MIIYRVIQGVDGGALIPISLAILRETFPPKQQGMAMALYGMGVVIAPALGPVCGGWLTDTWSWPWIFYINLPVCAGGMLLTMKLVNDPPYLRRGIQSVDWCGIILLTVFLTGMQIVLKRGQEEQWFDSSFIIYWTIATLLTLVLLIFWELRAGEPVVNFRVLKNKNLVLRSVMGLVFGVSLFGAAYILPQFTQQILGNNAFESGLALMLFMPVTGWLYPRTGANPLVLAGYADLAPPLIIMGVGMPAMFVPLSSVSPAP